MGMVSTGGPIAATGEILFRTNEWKSLNSILEKIKSVEGANRLRHVKGYRGWKELKLAKLAGYHSPYLCKFALELPQLDFVILLVFVFENHFQQYYFQVQHYLIQNSVLTVGPRKKLHRSQNEA